MNIAKELAAGFLKTWMIFIRQERFRSETGMDIFSPSHDYRLGRVDGLRLAESTLGLLAYEQGIDLRNPEKPQAKESESDMRPYRVGSLVRIPLEAHSIVAYPEAIHMLFNKDGTASVWCNGTEMGQLTLEQRECLEDMLSRINSEKLT